MVTDLASDEDDQVGLSKSQLNASEASDREESQVKGECCLQKDYQDRLDLRHLEWTETLRWKGYRRQEFDWLSNRKKT